MKVSVLIPIYGVENYIAYCVTNLMEQTYKDVEYIFVNDCTPDASIDRLNQVLESYPERKSQVRIIDHEQNMGLAMARLTALNAATGDAVIFVDSDDYVAPKMVEMLVAQMQCSEADIIDAGFAIVSKSTITKNCLPKHTNDKVYLKTILCQNVEPNRIWGRLIKKCLFEQNNISFTPGVDYSEDFSVLPRLLVNARRSWVDEILYYCIIELVEMAFELSELFDADVGLLPSCLLNPFGDQMDIVLFRCAGRHSPVESPTNFWRRFVEGDGVSNKNDFYAVRIIHTLSHIINGSYIL